MASIDDIWDAPAISNSPKTPRHLDTDGDDSEAQRPSKRQKQALFLSDSEDEGENVSGMRRRIVRAPPPMDDSGMHDDIEAMFADAENDDGLSFKKIGDLDVAAMEREAEERHRRATPLIPHPTIPSNSSAPDGGTPGNGTEESHHNKSRGKDEKKRARPVLLNENLLLGPTGFPDLVSQLKSFQVKGKGREAEDLTRLMRVYNFWTHKLHPKLKFHDTVVRIEKLCHTKRMQVALSYWRDEAHDKTHEVDADLSLDSDEDDENRSKAVSINESTRSGNTSSEAPTSPHPIPPSRDTERDGFSLPPSSRASSQPPTSDFPDDDALPGPSTSSHSRLDETSTMSTSAAAKKRIELIDDDEEESFWKDLETARTSQPTQRLQPLSKLEPLDDLDDAEVWAALEEVTNQSSATLVKSVSGNSGGAPDKAGEMDIDDDDMWDIIRENENPAPTSPPLTEDFATAAMKSALNSITRRPTGERPMAESEMDWNDMYAN